MATEETRVKELEKRRVEELEETVRYVHLAEHKSLPAKDLLGVVSRKVTVYDEEKKKRVYHVVVTIDQADYDRITSTKDFINYAMPRKK